MPKKSQLTAVKVFYSYAHEDEVWRKRLDQHFSFLKREEKIVSWYDGELRAGEKWRGKIEEYLDSADIILLLVSAAFADSEFCYSVEMKRAMERHEDGEAVIVPILLHPCDWTNSPFAPLQALPRGDGAISEWQSTEKALYEVTRGVREVVEELIAKRSALPSAITEGWEDVPSANVPPPPAIDFVARKDREGRDIVERLKGELKQNRLSVLWGEGGVGKTTIAAEVARALASVFGEHIVWVSAEKRTDFTYSMLLNEIATQLGKSDLTKLATEPKEKAVKQLIATSPTLLILDNFETVAPGEKNGCADFLAARSRCPALITTRERVTHDAARHIHVESMDNDEARQFVERWIKQEARAPQTFNVLHYDEIIRTADARPYVLQWVLARIDLALEPRAVLEELSRAEGEVAERVFNRSFDLPQLGDDGRDTLLALSLFSPSASRTALANVAGLSDDIHRLNEAVKRLATLRLIEAADGGLRLAVKGLTRTLALSRLFTDERIDEFRRRYLAHFLQYTEAHLLTTPEDLDALEVEKDNLLGAIDAAVAIQDLRSLIGLIADLNEFFLIHGHWDEAVISGLQAQAVARQLSDDVNAAVAIANVAIIRKNRGEYDEAKKVYREALEIFKRSKFERNAAACLLQLAGIAAEQSEFKEASQFYSDGLEIMKKLNDQEGVASSLHNLAVLREEQGDINEALRLYRESLQVSKKLGAQSKISKTLNQLAGLAWKRGDLKEARRLCYESLEIKRLLGDQFGIASTTRNLGLLAEGEGNPGEALRLIREALRIFEKLGSPWAEEARHDLTRLESQLD
jgi:tetratricopeptide (TPR) repeat protein